MMYITIHLPYGNKLTSPDLSTSIVFYNFAASFVKKTDFKWI